MPVSTHEAVKLGHYPKFGSPTTALLSCVDEAHAVALVLKFPRDGKDFPAVILALIFVGWRSNAKAELADEGVEVAAAIRWLQGVHCWKGG
jgi:hypothetical protein